MSQITDHNEKQTPSLYSHVLVQNPPLDRSSNVLVLQAPLALRQ